MDGFLRCCAAVLLSLIMILTLGGKGKDISALLGLLVCAMTLMMAMRYLEPVLEFIQTLSKVGNLNQNLTSILLKAVGIGLISEITCLICSDAGNASLGKTLQILSTSVILWLSIPLFTMVLELVQGLLGEL